LERNIPCEYRADVPRKRRRIDSTHINTDPQHGESWDYVDPSFVSSNAVEEWQDQFVYPSTDWDTCILASTETSCGVIAADEHDVEEIVRPLGTGLRSPSQDSTLAMIAPMPMASPLLGLRSPLFMEFAEARNRRVLLGYFTDVLSPLMVFTEETGNPFQQLVLPMSASSPPILNAILALSCAHGELRGIYNEEKSLDFHTRALQELGETLKRPDAGEEIITAIVMLIYYEVVSFGMDHPFRILSFLAGSSRELQHRQWSPEGCFKYYQNPITRF
jgi:hypothetical protein